MYVCTYVCVYVCMYVCMKLVISSRANQKTHANERSDLQTEEGQGCRLGGLSFHDDALLKGHCLSRCSSPYTPVLRRQGPPPHNPPAHTCAHTRAHTHTSPTS